jgi:hypothetical protein
VVGSRGALAMVVVVPRPSTTGRRRRADDDGRRRGARHRQTPTRCELHSSICEEEEEEEEDMMGKGRLKVLFVQSSFVRSFVEDILSSSFSRSSFFALFCLLFPRTTTGGRRTKKKKEKKRKREDDVFCHPKNKGAFVWNHIGSILKFSFRWSMLLSNPLLCSSQYY